MKLKKKYYLIGAVLLVAAFFAYHFYAASQAEKQIDKAIQEQSNRIDSLSVQYAAIEIAPFSATISIKDLTIIAGDHIERAQHLQLDMQYLDFVNMYAGGTTYGLKHLTKADLTILQLRYVHRKERSEIKLDTLNINYQGNALAGLQSAVNGRPFATTQAFTAKGGQLTLSFPQTTLYKITAESLHYNGSISAGNMNFWRHGSHQFVFDSLRWNPSPSFQQSYGFFIKGFGYETDAIPFKSAHIYSEPTGNTGTVHLESTVTSDLALFSASGLLEINRPFSQSRFKKMRMTVTEFSNKFQNVLSNLEQLLSVSLTDNNKKITLMLEGSLAAPSVSKN